MIVGCAALYWEEYIIQRWHIYIIYVLITWMAIGMNIFGSRILPLWNKLISKFLSYKSKPQLLIEISVLLPSSPCGIHYYFACMCFSQLPVGGARVHRLGQFYRLV